MIDQRQAVVGRNLLLFDGLCGMCNDLIRFLMRRDMHRRLRYAPLESGLGREMLALTAYANCEGIVLMEEALTDRQQVSAKSDAAVRILRLLPGAWPVVGILLSWVPRRVREWGYDLIARWRYRFFGAYDVCPLPSVEERALILGAAAFRAIEPARNTLLD